MTVSRSYRNYRAQKIRNIVFIAIAGCGVIAILLFAFRNNTAIKEIDKDPGETFGYIYHVTKSERINQTVTGSKVSVTYNHLIKYIVDGHEYQLTKSTGYVIQKDTVLIRYLIGEPEKAYVFGE